MRLGLTGKIIFSFMLLNLVVVWIEGLVVYHQSAFLLADKLRHELGEELDIEKKLIEERIVQFRQDVIFLSRTSPVHGIIRAQAAGGIDPKNGRSETLWKQHLSTLFKHFLDTHPHYFQIRYIGKEGNGKEIVRVERQEATTLVTPPEALQVKGDTDYFRDALSLSPDEIYFSQIELNREYGVVSVPHLRTLRVAVAVHDANSEAFGIVVINVNFNATLADLVKTVSPPIRLYLTNYRGDFLVHPQKALEFAFEFGAPRRIQDLYPTWADQLKLYDENKDGGNGFQV